MLSLILLNLTFPMALWPSKLVVEYGKEATRFLLGIRSKTMYSGNGIDVEAIRPTDRGPAWTGQKLTLVAVASVAFWHGLDRVITGIHNYCRAKSTSLDAERLPDVHLWVVGDGDERSRLAELAEFLGVGDRVSFTGWLQGDKLERIYSIADIGVGSLGLHRKGLREASELKLREYACKGLPFIMSARDPDFEDPLPFVFRVPRDESSLDLRAVIGWYAALCRTSYSAQIRGYARERLSWESKLKSILARVRP